MAPKMDFENLVSSHESYDVGVCCLGTTLKKAGSKDNYRQIDKMIPLGFVRFFERTRGSKISFSLFGRDKFWIFEFLFEGKRRT